MLRLRMKKLKAQFRGKIAMKKLRLRGSLLPNLGTQAQACLANHTRNFQKQHRVL
jgi:hypothetical protein